eukprot:TRINITY_DN12672_c2_g1_i3.p1 TRINITY_DN12672_c2_g1~~TRINITY_DN12672_c2_g1_i3.p1  ORF type:complete len:707 (+),score=117.52 TRINITY_DN12672_c2_g1_i3:102-2222(+)
MATGTATWTTSATRTRSLSLPTASPSLSRTLTLPGMSASATASLSLSATTVTQTLSSTASTSWTVPSSTVTLSGTAPLPSASASATVTLPSGTTTPAKTWTLPTATSEATWTHTTVSVTPTAPVMSDDDDASSAVVWVVVALLILLLCCVVIVVLCLRKKKPAGRHGAFAEQDTALTPETPPLTDADRAALATVWVSASISAHVAAALREAFPDARGAHAGGGILRGSRNPAGADPDAAGDRGSPGAQESATMQLARLRQAHQSGALTTEEYDAATERLVNSSTLEPSPQLLQQQTQCSPRSDRQSQIILGGELLSDGEEGTGASPASPSSGGTLAGGGPQQLRRLLSQEVAALRAELRSAQAELGAAVSRLPSRTAAHSAVRGAADRPLPLPPGSHPTSLTPPPLPPPLPLAAPTTIPLLLPAPPPHPGPAASRLDFLPAPRGPAAPAWSTPYKVGSDTSDSALSAPPQPPARARSRAGVGELRQELQAELAAARSRLERLASPLPPAAADCHPLVPYPVPPPPGARVSPAAPSPGPSPEPRQAPPEAGPDAPEAPRVSPEAARACERAAGAPLSALLPLQDGSEVCAVTGSELLVLRPDESAGAAAVLQRVALAEVSEVEATDGGTVRLRCTAQAAAPDAELRLTGPHARRLVAALASAQAARGGSPRVVSGLTRDHGIARALPDSVNTRRLSPLRQPCTPAQL